MRAPFDVNKTKSAVVPKVGCAKATIGENAKVTAAARESKLIFMLNGLVE